MNRLSPYRPGYVDLGPLPPPEEFNSLEELLNTKWLTEHMRIDKDNESIKIKNIQIEKYGEPNVTYYWVMLSNPLTDQFVTIGKLDTLEHIPKDMLLDEEQFTAYAERMRIRSVEHNKMMRERREKEKINKELQKQVDEFIINLKIKTFENEIQNLLDAEAFGKALTLGPMIRSVLKKDIDDLKLLRDELDNE